MIQQYRASRPGTVFRPETGKLYVFTPDSVTVMQPWPPMAWRKTLSNPHWTSCRPKISIPKGNLKRQLSRLSPPSDKTGQLLFPDCFLRHEKARILRKLAWLHWLGNIPEDILRVVQKFSSRQWQMLSFLGRCGDAAADLVASNPAVGFMLSNNWVFKSRPVQKPLRAARSQVAKKQRHILEWLDWPSPTESTRKTLAKIVPPAINISTLLYLRQAMSDAWVAKTMSHLTRINAGVIRIITDPDLSRLVSPTFLEEVGHSRKEDKAPVLASYIWSTRQMYQALFPDRKFPQIRQIEQLSDLHSDLNWDLSINEDPARDYPFPPPPFDGSAFALPITSVVELVREGLYMDNCVASYIDRIVKHQVYIYRIYKILGPTMERCTLSLKRRGDSWTIGELKKAKNEPPSKEVRKAVEIWLSQSLANKSNFEDKLPEDDMKHAI